MQHDTGRRGNEVKAMNMLGVGRADVGYVFRMNRSGTSGFAAGAWSRGLARVLEFGLVLGLVAGCALPVTKESSPDRKREAVTKRAEARWALIIAGDPGAAYDAFMSRGSRQLIPRTEFVTRMGRLAYRSAKVEKVECAVEACQVAVAISYDHPMKKDVRNVLSENWIIEDKQIWFVWSQ